MKHVIMLIFTMLTLSVYGQDKYNYIQFNKLTALQGTEYVIATIENAGKAFSSHGEFLLFINGRTGQTKQIDFPKDAYINSVEQIKLDSFQINKVVVTAKTINLDNSKTIDWGDPSQIFVLSTDGQEKTQLTPDNFYTGTWLISSETGSVVVTGYYDSNKNGKHDKTDKHEILLYDLKTLKLISRPGEGLSMNP
ncbi:hypothetical protein [Chitinophaga barathri]|uniref:Uncharacterized protein n=1 Tax=Chitinophaga barathri TaxID=1647451 RepID=A0A3N4MIL7_9BACT|nr:hypothetical protein [Chitinophaga barathri]RPD39499.1 hypothetical protein EG028_20490 [Chitinophaga barathri]